MLVEFVSHLQRRPIPAFSFALFLVCTLVMAWMRFGPYADSLVNVGYGLPLLVCLWYPDRRLLWVLMGMFALLATAQIFVLTPHAFSRVQFADWSLQMFSMVVIGLAVHLAIDLFRKLRRKKVELEESNRELMAREEEISRQNEELRIQAEELAQQNEEIQQQTEELQSQTEELQVSNAEATKRQAILQAMLESLQSNEAPDLPERICHLLISLLGADATAAVVLEKEGPDLVVLAQAGPIGLPTRRWPFNRSFAAVVMGTDHTACVPDLQLRPDLEGVQTSDSLKFRSVLATPLRLAGRPAGVVKVYSNHRHEWTVEQFKIVEWLSAQCSLLMDSRRLQSELQRTNADLDRLVKVRTDELQELVNDLEHFSYTITHDLRAPLRAMTGFASLLEEEKRDSLDASSREYIKRIITAAGRMDRLITDALSYSQLVRRQMPMEPIDVGALLSGMIESYPIFQEPKARIEIVGGLPRALGNEAGLTQCFSNLLGNAVKFVPPDTVPHVRIRAEQRDHRVRFWCEDNGIGIPAELQARVFGMFQRLSKNYEGTGIGLALVKKVAERMGGAVGLESEEGKGSRFWVEFQAADGDACAADEPFRDGRRTS
ncbi:MAG TPA: ATP-binding protein [Rariglobus sp.]